MVVKGHERKESFEVWGKGEECHTAGKLEGRVKEVNCNCGNNNNSQIQKIRGLALMLNTSVSFPLLALILINSSIVLFPFFSPLLFLFLLCVYGLFSICF